MTLTVTDNGSLTDTATASVSPTAPGANYAADTFSRTVTNGWGRPPPAERGHIGAGASNFSVDGTVGRIRIPAAGGGSGPTLTSVAKTDVDTSMSIGTDKPLTGGPLFVSVRGRNVPGVGDYRAKVRFKPDGGIGLSLVRVASGAETTIQSDLTIPGLTYSVGERIDVASR